MCCRDRSPSRCYSSACRAGPGTRPAIKRFGSANHRRDADEQAKLVRFRELGIPPAITRLIAEGDRFAIDATVADPAAEPALVVAPISFVLDNRPDLPEEVGCTGGVSSKKVVRLQCRM